MSYRDTGVSGVVISGSLRVLAHILGKQDIWVQFYSRWNISDFPRLRDTGFHDQDYVQTRRCMVVEPTSACTCKCIACVYTCVVGVMKMGHTVSRAGLHVHHVGFPDVTTMPMPTCL